MTDQNERSELVGSDEVGTQDRAEDSAGAATPDSTLEAATCGPGCDCGSAPPRHRAIKTAITVLVLLGVVAALVYGRTGNTKQTGADQMAAGSSSAFSVAQAAQEPTPGPAAQSPQGVAQERGAGSGVSGPQPAPATMPEPTPPAAKSPAAAQSGNGAVHGPQPQERKETEGKPAKTSGRIGERLESMSDLNKVAMSQDAVFIFVPGSGTESAAGQTQEAVRAAQKALTSKSIALGLYTLPTSSPDYPALSKQLSGPAIIVASKGRGMAAVSGEVTEDKLLQAFVASSRAGGCGGSSGCAPGASCPTN